MATGGGGRWGRGEVYNEFGGEAGVFMTHDNLLEDYCERIIVTVLCHTLF